jgi:hypothetical protein
MSSSDPRERAVRDVVLLLEEHGYQVRSWDMSGTFGSALVEMDVRLTFDWTDAPSNQQDNATKDEGTTGS